MKLKFKKGIKSILAFAMAMIMALLPVGDILPEVFAGSAGIIVKYGNIKKEDGNNVKADDIQLYKDGVIVKGKKIGAETSTVEWNSITEGSYTVVIKYNDYISYKVSETLVWNQVSTKTSANFTDEKLMVTEDTTIQIQSNNNITITKINGADVTSSEYTILADTPISTPITFTFEASLGTKVECTDSSALTGTKPVNGKRTYTYTTTVQDILKQITGNSYTMRDITVGSADMGTITCQKGVTLSIPDGWSAGDSGSSISYYKPLDGESFTITVTPENGYKFKGVTAEGSANIICDSTNGTITVDKTSGNFIVKAVLTKLPTPTGTLKITPKYGSDNNKVYPMDQPLQVTFTPTNMETGYTLEMGWNKEGEGAPANIKWMPLTDNQDGSYTCTIPKNNERNWSQYIICRYTSVDGASDPYLYERIEYDWKSPTVGKVSLGSTAKFTNKENYPLNIFIWEMQEEVWVNKDGNNDTSIILSEITDATGVKGTVRYIFTDNATAGVDANWLEATLSEDGTVKIPYNFNNKNQYLRYAIYDNSGNVEIGTVDLGKIKFDLEAPNVPSVKVQDDKGTELNEEQLQNWQPKGVKLTFELADEGQEQSGIAGIKVTDDVSGTEVDISDKVTTEDGKYVLVFGDNDNGEHHLKITAIDNAGNVSDPKEITVKLDTKGIQNPTVFLSSVNSGNIDPTQTEFAKEFTIIAQATSVSGIEKEKVEITVDTGNGDFTIPPELFTINKESGDVYTIICKYTPETSEFKGKIRVKFVDNVATENSTIDGVHVKVVDHDLIYNRNGAKISILGNTSWTNGDVRLNIAASSKSTTITEVRYYVNGTLVQTIPVNGLQYADTGFTIRENSSMAGTEVRIEAVCGTNPESQIVNSESIVVHVDKQAPALRLAGVTEGAVYNTNRALQITTVENVYNAMKPVQVTATRTIDGATTNIDLGAYQVQSGSDVTNKIFTEDGVYRVTILAEDAAGNRDSKTVSFTIDKTAPVLNITGVTEGAYSNRPVTLNFQSIESFFETNNVRIMVERRLDGTTYGRNVIFANTAKNSSVSNTFSEDGDYTITMSAIDAAGNEAAVKTLTFTVDCTAPAVSLTGTKDYFVTQSAVALDFSVIESYYQTNQVQIQASRRLANGKVETVAIPAWSNSGKNSSLRQQFTEDGYYTVNITATDKAGNRKEQTIHFTIDTEKPAIADLSKYDGKYLKSFRLEEDMDTLITELTVPTVKMTLNGEAYDGSEVTADGKYTFVIEVTDEVGLTASKTIEFVIDNTLPKIIFAGAEDGKWYTDVVRLNVSLENENDTITEILINGEPYTLTEGKTAYDLTFDTFGDYEVTINSVDAAGNTNSQTISFTYAEHKKVTWLWIGGGAVVLLAGVGVGVMVFMKKGNTNADA